MTCCVRLHGTTTMLPLVAYSLKLVKVSGPCKWTQNCSPTAPNNVGSCWHLLRPFAWAFKRTQHCPKTHNNTQQYTEFIKPGASMESRRDSRGQNNILLSCPILPRFHARSRLYEFVVRCDLLRPFAWYFWNVCCPY